MNTIWQDGGYSLLDLFNLKPNAELREQKQKQKIIKLAEYLCLEMESMCEDFLDGHLNKFDPHVGETSCQFRAYLVALLYAERASFVSEVQALLQQTKTLLTSLKALQHEASGQKRHQAKSLEYLESFLADHGILALRFSGPIRYCLLCHLLARYNLLSDEGFSLAIDIMACAGDIGASKNYTAKLLHRYQQIVAEMTCQYLIALAESVEAMRDKVPVLKQLQRVAEYNRLSMACYFGVDVIVEHALESGIAILLEVHLQVSGDAHVLHVLAKPNQQDRQFHIVTDLTNLEDQPVFVCRLIAHGDAPYYDAAKMMLLNRFMSYGVKELLLMYMARHPQYSGRCLARYRYDPFLDIDYDQIGLQWQQRFLEHRRLADQLGCCVGNQSLFYIKHCHAGRLMAERYEIQRPAIRSRQVLARPEFILACQPQLDQVETSLTSILQQTADTSSGRLTIQYMGLHSRYLLQVTEGLDSFDASYRVMEARQQWQLKQQPYLDSLPLQCRVIHWQKWLKHRCYAQKLAMVQRLSRRVESVAVMLRQCVDDLYESLKPLMSESALTKEEAEAILRQYWYEWAAVRWLWWERGMMPDNQVQASSYLEAIAHHYRYATVAANSAVIIEPSRETHAHHH